MTWQDDYVERAAPLIADADGDGYASPDEEVRSILSTLIRRTVEEAAVRARTAPALNHQDQPDTERPERQREACALAIEGMLTEQSRGRDAGGFLRAQLAVASKQRIRMYDMNVELWSLCGREMVRTRKLEAALTALLAIPVIGVESDDSLLRAHMKLRGQAAALLNGDPSPWDQMP